MKTVIKEDEMQVGQIKGRDYGRQSSGRWKAGRAREKAWGLGAGTRILYELTHATRKSLYYQVTTSFLGSSPIWEGKTQPTRS